MGGSISTGNNANLPPGTPSTRVGNPASALFKTATPMFRALNPELFIRHSKNTYIMGLIGTAFAVGLGGYVFYEQYTYKIENDARVQKELLEKVEEEFVPKKKGKRRPKFSED